MTLGHADLMRRASQLFGRLILAVAAGHHKRTMFSLDERLAMARELAADYPNVEVMAFSGLLRDFVVAQGGKVVVRGLRAVSDFEYEFQIAQMNSSIGHDIETMFMMISVQYGYLSSSIVKEVCALGGTIDGFVPPEVKEALRIKYGLSEPGC